MPDQPPSFIQEPDTLITAAPKPKSALVGKMWIVKRVHRHMVVGGHRINVVDEDSGVTGFLPVFDSYEKALFYVEGDTSLIAGIEPVT